MADHALRTIGVAFRPMSEPACAVEENLVFIGVLGIIDPPREEVRDAVARAANAGVRTVMITGDHPRTATVVAREIGIESDRVLTGADLERMSDDALADSAQTVSVYARVNPEHKLRLVRALQRRGAIVAMTGDGVNDAPALKSADIGVAMGVTGTDVSRQAADIVLADDNFATIVAACEEGRAIFSNVRRVLQYLLSSNIGEVLTMFFGILLGPRIGLRRIDGALVLPLLATQILWINLVTDGAPALALGVEPASPDLASRPPRGRTEPVVTGAMWRDIVLIGTVTALATLAVFDASLPGGYLGGAGDLRYAQTMAFTTLTLAQLFNAFNARAGERSAFVGLLGNRWLLGAIVLSLLLQMLVVYTPALQRAFGTMELAAIDWLRCAIAASTVLVVGELLKLAGARGSPTRASAIRR
jgi:Ca2+-transporting ATPase